MSTYLLFELASGYCLFKCHHLDEIENNLEVVRNSVDKIDRFSPIVRCISYQEFVSAGGALNQLNVVSQGQMTDELQNFLEVNLPKLKKRKEQKFSVGVADPKLGSHKHQLTSIPKDPFLYYSDPWRKKGTSRVFFIASCNNLRVFPICFRNVSVCCIASILKMSYVLRALKTHGNLPKYGLIFHSSLIGRASARKKGRVARILANKCAIAARVDCFSENDTTDFGVNLRERVEERLNFYERPEPSTKRSRTSAMKALIVSNRATERMSGYSRFHVVVTCMHVGGRRRIIIPSCYGHGSENAPWNTCGKVIPRILGAGH